MSEVKLTKAQRDVLVLLRTHEDRITDSGYLYRGGVLVYVSYPTTVRALERKGWISNEDLLFGYRITDAGRKAVTHE